MKVIFKSLFLLLGCQPLSAQTSIQQQVDSIRYLKGDAAFGCNSVIWRIVAKKKEAAPYLITLIADSTPIPVTYRCKEGSNMKVGDMAFYVLNTIVDVPMFFVTNQQFDLIYDDCQVGVYSYIDGNRLVFQKQVQDWYVEYKDQFVWEKYLTVGRPTGCRAIDGISGSYHMPETWNLPPPPKKERVDYPKLTTWGF